jgi:hypothetical protein
MIEKEKTYRFVISIAGQNLFFTGKVIVIENNFVTFIDIKGKTLSYNLGNILSFEEVKW